MFPRNLPPPPKPTDDWPAGRIHDPALFTRVLVNSGYRLYELYAGGKAFHVWAKPVQVSESFHLGAGKKGVGVIAPMEEVRPLHVSVSYGLPDLSALAEGDVFPAKSREVLSTDFIMIDDADGGYMVSGYDRHRE